MSSKKNILLISKVYSSFVKEDINILSESYSVDFYLFKTGSNKMGAMFQLIKLCFFLLFRLRRYTVYLSWFADFYTVPCFALGRFLRRTNVVIVGGFDAVAVPVIQFGTFYKNNLQTKAIKKTYHLADYILPVDDSLIQGMNFYIDRKGQKIGIKNFVTGIKAKFKTIPTGYSAEKWKRDQTVERKKSIVTIGGCSDLTTYKRKGLDFFIKVANEMPDTQFTVVGLRDKPFEVARSEAAENVNILGYVSQQELIRILSAHTVFAQLSLSEGLPNTLCEAMMCECIPVGSSANGIPLAIGETGYVLEYPDVEMVKNLFIKALNDTPEKGTQARERILKLFPKEKRKTMLSELFDSF